MGEAVTCDAFGTGRVGGFARELRRYKFGICKEARAIDLDNTCCSNTHLFVDSRVSVALLILIRTE